VFGFLMLATGLDTVALLERTLGRRRKFSYLDEYEGAPSTRARN
jgi:hypothetical protein